MNMENKTAVSSNFSHFFNIGQVVDLEIKDGGRDRFQSHLVGLKKDNYLLIEQPSYGAFSLLHSRIFNRQQLIVRTIDDKVTGKVIGFRSTLEYRLEKPERLLAISYPQSVEIIELRNKPRILIYEPCKVYLEDQESPLSGLITDYSLLGCRIEVEMEETKATDVDIKISIEFKDPLTREDSRKTATIKSMRKQGGLIQLGLAFEN